ncbi:site-2 protease family protein [Candidatus Microgenomates bacterium]|nr:site-2 protease family protein [Candidatus Microgenomates bacterium]
MFNFSDPTQLLLFIGALLTAITVHEFSHALLADRLGDPTPRLQGRLTLNPLAHLDPLGTLMLLLVHFGWGKPVQFDPFNLKDPRRDAALISFAGPASNFVLATFLGIVVRALPETLFYVLPFIQLNIILGVFNLLPVHPLDGGKVLIGLLEPQTARVWDRFLQRYGLFILLFLILPLFGGNSAVALFIVPIINLLLTIIVPLSSLI